MESTNVAFCVFLDVYCNSVYPYLQLNHHVVSLPHTAVLRAYCASACILENIRIYPQLYRCRVSVTFVELGDVTDPTSVTIAIIGMVTVAGIYRDITLGKLNMSIAREKMFYLLCLRNFVLQ